MAWCSFAKDGSDGSRHAIHSVAHLLVAKSIVVLTVWQPFVVRVAKTGGFGVWTLPDTGPDPDVAELRTAQDVAESAAARARKRGLQATARTQRSEAPVWEAIIAIADERSTPS